MIHLLLLANKKVNIRSTWLPMVFHMFLSSKDPIKSYTYFDVNYWNYDHILNGTIDAPILEDLQHAFFFLAKLELQSYHLVI